MAVDGAEGPRRRPLCGVFKISRRKLTDCLLGILHVCYFLFCGWERGAGVYPHLQPMGPAQGDAVWSSDVYKLVYA